MGKLVHDFKCTSPDDMYYDVLAKRVRHFKETEGGIAHMCKLMEDMRNEAEIKSAIDTARRYKISEDNILADIMKQFGLTEEQAKDYMLKESA